MLESFNFAQIFDPKMHKYHVFPFRNIFPLSSWKLKLLRIPRIQHNCNIVRKYSKPPTEGTSTLSASFRMPLENFTTYQLLKALPNYESTFFNPTSHGLDSESTWSAFKPIVQEYRTTLNTNTENDNDKDLALADPPIFRSSLFKSILDESSNLTDLELWSILYLTRLIKERNYLVDLGSFTEFWKGLDQECVKRFPYWDKTIGFQVDDLWYNLHLARVVNFHWSFTKKLFRKVDKLTKEEYVRFMFCINLLRKLIDAIGTYELEHNLNNHVDSLQGPELGVVAMAFFKTECPIQDNNLLEKFVDRAIECAPTADPLNISVISKLVRLSGRSRNSLITYKYQNGIQNELDRLNITGAVHVAIAGTRNNVFCYPVLQKVSSRIENNLKDTRLKELERLLLALTMFSMDCDGLIRKIFEDLENPDEHRTKELILYGRALPSILFYGAIRGVYSYKLANHIFDPEFLHKYYGHNFQKYQREIYCLDHAMEIECPDYTGHKLASKLKKSIAKQNMLWLKPDNQKVSRYEASLRNVKTTLADILGGKQFVHSCNLLPQYHTAEIVFCLDDQNNPVEIPSSFLEIPEHEIKTPVQNNGRNLNYHILMLNNYAACISNQPKQLVGYVKLQLRLLEKMGYKVHVTYLVEWENIQGDTKVRTEFIRNLISRDYKYNNNEKKEVSAQI